MKILGISTASHSIGVAIIENNGLVCELNVNDNEVQSEDIVSMIDLMEKKFGKNIDDLQAVAVTNGPGSYGGLRGGLAAAKSFAHVKKIQIVGISTLEAIAFNMINCGRTIVSILHACRDETNIAMFGARNGSLVRLTRDFVIKDDKLQRLKKKIGDKVCICDTYPYARNVAFLGVKHLEEGKTDNFLNMAPNYSHKPNIREYGNKN